MPTLSNVKITKVQRVKDGTGKRGPWVLYNIWIDDEDWKTEKFGYLQSGKNPVPTEGMKLISLDYEEKESEDGRYINYNVKNLATEEQEKPKPRAKKGQPGARQEPRSLVVKPGDRIVGPDGKELYVHPVQNPWSMLCSFVKDTLVALINANPEKYRNVDLDQVIYRLIGGTILLYDASRGKLPAPKPPETAPKTKGSTKEEAEKSPPESTSEPNIGTQEVPEGFQDQRQDEPLPKFNIKPVLKAIVAKVTEIETTDIARAMVEVGITPKRANAIQKYLKEVEEVSTVDFVGEIHQIWKANPLDEVEDG